MKTTTAWIFAIGLALTSCTPTTTGTPDATPAELEPAVSQNIPATVEGKFNVAFVYVGPVGDAGWTYAHDQGRQYLQTNLEGVHTAYVESGDEAAEQVLRGLARERFDLIVATSLGFMDACAAVAEEFPAVKIVHVSGFKKNDTNFGNLSGAMEQMKYLAGMIAAARAMEDGGSKIGYVAPFPNAEVIRHLNAVALGALEVCPECAIEVRWINTRFDPAKERAAADSLLEAGAQVVITGAGTPEPLVAAGEKERWGIGYGSANACQADPEHCLTVPYWDWGPTYVGLVEAIQEGSWKPDDVYLGADTGLVALYGFMEGQQPAPGVPEAVIPLVREKLTGMQASEDSHFELFNGVVLDNKGEVIVPDDVVLTQEDLEGLEGVSGRPDCTICMNWLAKGVVGALP